MSDTVIRIKGGRVIDPYRGVDSHQEDIWIQDGRFVAGEDARGRETVALDAEGLWVVPRLVDMHVHFREPGQTWKETIRSGSQAAAHGGVAVVAAMPNTTPVIDTPELVEWVRRKGHEARLVRVLPIGAVTLASQGEDLADLYRMQEAGAVGFSDDGRPVTSSRLMRAALSYSTTLNAPIINHAEDRSLADGGAAHEGGPAGRLGIPGIPEAAESAMVWRDVLLAGLTGGRLHVAHVSALESVEAIRYAKQRGYQVTAEATPHHLLLTDEALNAWQYNTVTKVNPPLRPDASRQALLKAVRDGLIDVLASDHAPHHADEKQRPYPDAPFGISGLETIVAGLITALVEPGLLAPLDAFKLMTSGPDRVLGLGYRGMVPGEQADVALIDPQQQWTVEPGKFYSLGKNTPFQGMMMTGKAVATIVDGRVVMQDGEVLHAGLSSLS